MAALGWQWVKLDLAKHKRRTRKVVAATLKRRGSDDATTSVAYGNAYVYPDGSQSGYGGAGYPTNHTQVTLWRVGETYPPRVDDKLTVSGTTYLIAGVTSRLNGDESRNYAVYDLDVTGNG